ncbi:RIO-like kinase [Methanosalsum zhilinae DSM 4017]|uniref:non-specific serine/threonine protein kinase n=1 Tax=Methanosalsum zhilinae (strain DSM 4017 / NBRC 107636 / OCM 62 / WeN5) TaxID=679901 RepID=F7XK91_METZD|nr:serine/threonine-protein kinase RIO2 [Methanosalsum zhilinae]AEH60556.1 RIO-like kinase [Methanosalsum zhilinae DSM 4017]
MIDQTVKIFKELDSRDIRILMGIEAGMQRHEWVPVEELMKFTGFTYEKLQFKLGKLMKNDLVLIRSAPYEGYQIYFPGYDVLAINTFVKRNTVSAIGDEIGVGKESIVHEAISEPDIGIGDPLSVVIKFHRQGMTSFKQVKRTREHLVDKEHFSWIYAARLAAQREYDVMQKIYPDVSVPRPIDHNRHAIVMELIEGNSLNKTKLLDPQYFLDEILEQIKTLYSFGIIHADLSEYNIFVNPKGVKIIDWPQYVTQDHPHADELLERDVNNVLNHFSRKYKIRRSSKSAIEDICGCRDDS